MHHIQHLPPGILEQIHSYICDDALSETKREIVLNECGSVALRLLRDATTSLLSPFDESNFATDHAVAIRTLFKLADENINSSPFNEVNVKWLQLYTDSSILRTLIDLKLNEARSDVTRETWEGLVKVLDMAIIVAGGLGDQRMEWIQSIIAAVQTTGLPRVAFEEERRAKRRRIEPLGNLTWAVSPIPEIDPPTLSEYTSTRYCEPFILRRYLDSDDSPAPPWPAIKRWKSVDYLLDQVGEGRVVPVEVGRAYNEPGWGQTIKPFRDFLQAVGNQTAHVPLYLAQCQLFRQFPQLEKDMVFPDYVWSEPPAPDGVNYSGPQTEDGVLANVWVGGGGEVVSPAHNDPYFNCYAQVVGRKRVWLAPPDCAPHMYAYSGKGDEDDLAEKYMTNTSQVPILRDSADDCWEKYPLFFERVSSRSFEAVLEPGDLMIMPPGWWHAMRGESEGLGWSVSLWY